MVAREKKEAYFARVEKLLDEYSKILVVHADHVGSFQFQKIRMALRGKAVVLMGKNTMMRRILSDYLIKHPGHPIEAMIPFIQGNIGFILTNGDFNDIRDTIEENRVPAAARAGVMAECDVVVPPGPTGCDPGQTSWFQALNVPTKISRGQIEIVSELKLVTKGEKVGGSEAALLQKLNILPFTYGLVLKTVYDNGSIFDAAVLDITEEDLKNKFKQAVRRLASISLEIGYPTLASLPHTIGNAVKQLIAISSMIGYSFEQMKEWEPLFAPAAAEEEPKAEE